jgi:adenosine kinase
MDSQNIACVVIENPLMDITIQDNDGAVHEKYGLQAGMASLVDEKTMPIHDELFAREDRELTCGGAALNSARACQHLLSKKGADSKVCFFGCIAKDDAGAYLQKALTDANLVGKWAFTDEIDTGRCAVLVKGTERTLCANIGASAKYPPVHFDENKEMFEKAAFVYSTGFFITSSMETLQKVCKFAVEHKKPMLFNLSAVFLLQFFQEQVMTCIEHADFIFCNEDEGSAYAKWQELDEKDRVGAAKHMAKRNKHSEGPRTVIITQGSEQVIIVVAKPGSDEEPKVTMVDVPAIEKEKIVDTNGAGDAFVGGFLAEFTSNKDVEACVKAGIAMGGHVVQRLGCQFD